MGAHIERKQGCYWHLYVLFGFLTVVSFLLDTPSAVLNGFVRILLSPSNLLTDYIEIGGLGAAFFNSGVVGLLSVKMLQTSRVELNGAAIAGVITVCGFAFFGKNVYNSLPITIGVYLYSCFIKTPFKDLAITSLFATSLGPLVSLLSFGMGLSLLNGVFVGYLCGFLIGFIIPPLANAFYNFHQGYNLYNTGFTAGIVGMLATGILRMFNLQVNTVFIVSSGNNVSLSIVFLIIIVVIFLTGLYSNNWSLKNYRQLLLLPGRLRTDFVEQYGYGVTLINMAIMAFITWCYIIVIGGQINGPSIGAMLTIVGFSAFGKHPKNTIPVFIGAYLASMLNMHDPGNTIDVIAVLFGSTLAPITGSFGIFAGIFAGFVHVSMALNVGYLHGGINLYNNGFSGGFVAAILAPLFTIIKEKVQSRNKLLRDK